MDEEEVPKTSKDVVVTFYKYPEGMPKEWTLASMKITLQRTTVGHTESALMVNGKIYFDKNGVDGSALVNTSDILFIAKRPTVKP